ncbi:hypothetical protein NZ698_08765 [Chryseobacterium sp. PBS4-4]|uniref:Glycosyltransferase RgtA/B/C/D-like domain-containing protein n=1 Tax=Chryseobacterium edaphi TaxID=2976532 RepID=A0ABT2W500_9FLAO|nr:hypothetical protein [Chryseobacterium edaphi]MCU7617289.1 hypothetical protein [Chryseobacterium edaphi]
MKINWNLSILFTAFLLLALTYWNYQNRVYDWDMPGYIGSVLEYDNSKSPDEIRTITYTSIEKEAFPIHYADLIGTSPRDIPRQFFKKNTQAFTEQLPYFQIKVGYNLVILLFYKLGATLPMSVLLVSLISYFISGLLFFFIVKLIFPEKYLIAVLLTFCAFILPPMTYMSRVSTPDMFIFQFILILIVGLLKKWNSWVMFFLLFTITFIRPDYITMTLTYLFSIFLFQYFKERKLDFKLIFQGIILLALYFVIMKFYHYPGWKDLFYDSFISRRPIMSAQPANFGLKEYLDIIYIKIIYFKKVTLSLAIMVSVIFWLSKDLWTRIISLLFVINVYIKFFFFPQSAALRFFFPFIFPVFIMMLYAISQKYNGFRLNKIQ